MTKCPACLEDFGPGDFAALGRHFSERATASDGEHIRVLHQYVGKRRLDSDAIADRLRTLFDVDAFGGLAAWVRRRFIERFYSERPHPFVVALQRPSRATLLGYAIEHQHFLRQWVRSCAFVLAKTDRADVALYEIDNINTEFGGFGPDRPAHYELLLRMGESLGVDRATILATAPLPATRRAIEGWHRLAASEHWVATMVAMHGLELIASRDLVHHGAKLHYFDPAILSEDGIPAAAKAFLREGYEADVGHSEQALSLAERYARELRRTEDVQGAFLRSIDLFDDYLMARLERAERLAAT
jgi:pyrroloquinoline-quinone synthase